MHAQQSSRLRNAPSLVESGALVVLLLACSGAAWLVTTRLTTADMQVGLLTSPLVISSIDQMTAMGMPPFGPFVGMWAIMMAAMMLPSLWPAARAVDGTRRAAKQTFAVTVFFIAGYLLAWSATGPAANLIMVLLQNLPAVGGEASLRGGAILLLVAGAYQFTPLKQTCLRKCHAPHAHLALEERMGETRGLAPLARGLAHGAYCLGSSWPLMLVLLLLGMMNLAWMGVVALIILLEKTLPSGQVISKAVGTGLIAIGIILIAAPHQLPVLVGH